MLCSFIFNRDLKTKHRFYNMNSVFWKKMIPSKNYYSYQLRRWSSTSCKSTCKSQISSRKPGIVHCPNGNATDPIWRALAYSDGISSWTPLKPQHSNPSPNHLANQLWCIDFLTRPTPLIIPHRLPAFLESLMPLKNWCSIHARCSKSSLKFSIRFCGIFSKFKTEFSCISSF